MEEFGDKCHGSECVPSDEWHFGEVKDPGPYESEAWAKAERKAFKKLGLNPANSVILVLAHLWEDHPTPRATHRP